MPRNTTHKSPSPTNSLLQTAFLITWDDGAYVKHPLMWCRVHAVHRLLYMYICEPWNVPRPLGQWTIYMHLVFFTAFLDGKVGGLSSYLVFKVSSNSDSCLKLIFALFWLPIIARNYFQSNPATTPCLLCTKIKQNKIKYLCAGRAHGPSHYFPLPRVTKYG